MKKGDIPIKQTPRCVNLFNMIGMIWGMKYHFNSLRGAYTGLDGLITEPELTGLQGMSKTFKHWSSIDIQYDDSGNAIKIHLTIDAEDAPF